MDSQLASIITFYIEITTACLLQTRMETASGGLLVLMKKCIVITTLCLALGLSSVSCGSVDEEYLAELPKDYVFEGCTDDTKTFYEDDVVRLIEDENGLLVQPKFCFYDASIVTKDREYFADIVVAGYNWHLDDVSITDVIDFSYGEEFKCKQAKYKKVGQVSYQLYRPGMFIFCSEDRVIETCNMERSGIYRMITDSDVNVIYEVE